LKTPHEQCEVVVVGGGVIGLASAWRTAQAGINVVLLERGRLASGASHVAAGMLAPSGEADPGERSLLALGLVSAQRWPRFAEELARAGGTDPGYRRCSTLRVAGDRDDAEALEREATVRRELGIDCTLLRGGEAREREPALAPSIRMALELPDDHAVDPRRVCAALAAAARAAGASLRESAEVTRVLVHHGRVSGVQLRDGSSLGAERVIVAAGCWSGDEGLLPDGAGVPVRPVKGQILRLRDRSGPGLLSAVIRRKSIYLVPRGDGRYVRGATTEEQGFDTSVTAGAVWELIRDAAEVVPGVLELELEQAQAGLRPGTPDNAPLLGAGALDGLVWATGHHRNGILLCPITAEVVVSTLRGESLPDVAEPFLPGRFAPLGALA
jgi:glycine oxidase